MKYRIISFFNIVLLSIVFNVVYFGFCGSLMWLVSHSSDGFLAGVIVGGVLGFSIPLICIAYIIHSFVLIFQKD